jgi:hypothetical protein
MTTVGGTRILAAWLDHRNLAASEQMKPGAEHRHEGGAAASMPADGVARAQQSQLFVASLDGSIAPQAITSGVCYCCKTAIATGLGNSVYLAWRHVYAGNMRDIAFSSSKDGGKTFSAPVRVSEDKWQIDGCPEDGPSMVVDAKGIVHLVWPTVVTEGGSQVKALFYTSTRDGRSFTPRERIPTNGSANHPQLAIDANGLLALAWDEAGNGMRMLGSATGRLDTSGRVRFTRAAATQEAGTYPILISAQPGTWLRAWKSGGPSDSVIRLDTLN